MLISRLLLPQIELIMMFCNLISINNHSISKEIQNNSNYISYHHKNIHKLPTEIHKVINPSHATVLFLYPLKTSETRVFLITSGCIERDQWYEIGLSLVWKNYERNFLIKWQQSCQPETLYLSSSLAVIYPFSHNVEKWSKMLWNLTVSHRKILKHFWPFFNIMKERLNTVFMEWFCVLYGTKDLIIEANKIPRMF